MELRHIKDSSPAQRVVAAITVFVNSIKISANTETAMLSKKKAKTMYDLA